MAMTNALPAQAMAPPLPQMAPPPQQNVSLIDPNRHTNMSHSTLAEVGLILSGIYITLVQPEPGPVKVGLHAFFPNARGSFIDAATDPFSSDMKKFLTLKDYPHISSAFNLATNYSNNDYTPKLLLDTLCNQVFPQNTITLFYMNNHLGLQKYLPAAVKYLPSLMESMGLPIISYDTQFSFNTRPALSVQLAPTMGQMMDVIFAFLRRFNWTDFSFLCTLSFGCQEEITAIRQKVEESHRKPNLSVFGVDMFSFNLLSFVNFTDGGNETEVTEKLKYELHQDTRILLMHGEGGEVKNIMSVAERLGLTGHEYVWIYTISSITLSSRVSKSYPLGSFIIGYDSKRDDMGEVVKTGINIWLQALNSLAASPEMTGIDFETGFSCNRVKPGPGSNASYYIPGSMPLKKVPLRWNYGHLLYEHMLKVKLPGNFEFDHHGILKSNKFWIKNVQRREQRVSSTSSSGRRTGGLGRSRSGGLSFGGRSQTSGRSQGRSPSFMSRNRISDPRRPASRTSDSRRSRDRSSDRASPVGSNTKDRRPLFSRDSSSRIRNTDRAPSSGYGSSGAPGDYKTNSSLPDKRQGLFSRQSRAASLDREPLIHHGRAEDDIAASRRRWRRRADGWSFRPVPRLRTRRSMNKRLKRALDIRVAETIATWDGHNLSVTGITWPGGASKPPKGKPEKYTLRVVTWMEDPQVKFTEMRETLSTDEDPCDANSLPCKRYERDDRNMRISNDTVDACCTGLCIDLLKKLGEMLHFDVELTEVDEGAYGSPINENRTQWNGMLGKLVHGEADMAMGALSITPQRAEVVDFSVPFLQTGITIIVAIREGAISATAFLEPYDYPSWSLILVFSVHATGASIFIFEWLSPYGLDQGKTPLSLHKFSLFRSFWLIWAMLFGASVSTDQPRGCASRFLANIWALFAVVFCASYTANLAAFMITKDDFYDLSGIQDWRLKNPNHRKPPFKFATIEKSATDLNIADNYKEIHMYMKQNPQTDVKSAIRLLKDQKIQAFIYDSTTLEYEVGKDDGCRLKTVGKRIAETGYGVAFPKKSQWTQQVNKALLWLQEDGEIERLQKFWLAGACHKKKETGVSSHTLGIRNFTSAFILLGAGVVLGIVLLVMEHCYFRFGRKSLKKWDKCGCCSLVSLSMGQSLTFEQSVMEAIDFHRQHKCKDPLCETQLWKIKHELDLALLKIGQLRKQLAHTAALEASSEEMNMPEKMEEDYPPYRNGSARRRRRQKAGDDVTGKGQEAVADTRQPLLALEMGKGDCDSDEDPTSNTSRKYVGPTATDAQYAAASVKGHKPPSSYPERRGVPQESGDTLQGRPYDRAKPSTYSPPAYGANNVVGNDRARYKESDDPLPPYPSPPPFDEAMSSDIYTPPRSPTTESSLPPPNLTPPPPLRSPHSTADPRGQGPASSRGGPASFPPPPPPAHTPAEERQDVSHYTLAHTQPPGLSDTPAPTNPKSSVAQKDKSVEMPLTKSFEDDNDVSLRRQRNDAGNVYVNVDNIRGKETYF